MPRRVNRTYMSRARRRRRLLYLVAAVIVVVVLVIGGLAIGRSHGKQTASAGPTPTGRPTGKATVAARAPKPSPSAGWTGPPSSSTHLKLKKVIVSSQISPKSVVSTGTGEVWAQNMMYRHTITVYDSRTVKLIKTIPDKVNLATYGIKGHPGTVQGSPVEAAPTPDKRYMFVSQYSMYGDHFYREGHDVCSPSDNYDNSFVYRVSIPDLKIDNVAKVGATPKYVAVTPDGKYLLVSNWCSYTVSIVNPRTCKQLKQIYLGPYPRGIAVDPQSHYAYIAVMGSFDIARVDLRTFKLSWVRWVGSSPRHLVMSRSGKYLYATLNGEAHVVKIDLHTHRVLQRVYTGAEPRSMAMAPDGKSLYVVNYGANTMTKVRTSDMKVIQTVGTNALPIGITYDAPTHTVWVCCYTGSIMVFND